MSHGIFIKMINSENQKEEASKPVLKFLAANDNLTDDCKLVNLNDSSTPKMCLSGPKIVLNKQQVAEYYKMKKMPDIAHPVILRKSDNSNNSSCYEAKLKDEKNPLLVKSIEHVDHIRNKLLVDNKSSNTSAPIKNHNYKVDSCNKNISEDDHNFLSNENAESVKGNSIEMECGDDILFSNNNNYDTENDEIASSSSITMECGDDILFENEVNCSDEKQATAQDGMECGDGILFESEVDYSDEKQATAKDEMECGDDILFTKDAGYYNSDEDSTEENQNFSCDNDDYQIDIFEHQIKQEIDDTYEKLPVVNVYEEQENKFNVNRCHSQTFNVQQNDSYSAYKNSGSNRYDVASKNARINNNVSLLNQEQLKAHEIYFYTCKFCPSTSWYISTLKKHIELMHVHELETESIDNILESINRSKKLETEVKVIVGKEKVQRKKTVNQPFINRYNSKGKRANQPIINENNLKGKKITKTNLLKRKRRFIYYEEIKQFLKISCLECNVDPVYSKYGRTRQFCSQCQKEFTYECLKCSKIYFNYDSARIHSNRDCQNKRIKKIRPKKVKIPVIKKDKKPKKVREEKEKRLKFVVKKSETKKYFQHFCTICNESSEPKSERKEGGAVDKVCQKCNTNFHYKCDICKKLFGSKIRAQRHSLMCHRRNYQINSSLSTFALVDHNYYCKNVNESKDDGIDEKVLQPNFIELNNSQSDYLGNNNQSAQSQIQVIEF